MQPPLIFQALLGLLMTLAIPALLPDWKIEFPNPRKDFGSFEKRI
jgi:hypothetical protein